MSNRKEQSDHSGEGADVERADAGLSNNVNSAESPRVSRLLAAVGALALSTVGCPTDKTRGLDAAEADVMRVNAESPAYGQVSVTFVDGVVVVDGYTDFGGVIQVKVFAGEEEVYSSTTPVPQNEDGGYSLSTARAADLTNEDGRMKGPVIVKISDPATGNTIKVPLFN